MPKVRYTCSKCGKKCGNAGAYKNHMKTHDQKEPASTSLLRFLKRAPRKLPIELKPIVKKPKQLKLTSIQRRLPSAPRAPEGSPRSKSPPPSRLPRSKPISDLNPFRASENLVADSLDKKSLEFRIAHVRYFRTLKQTKFPFLDKKMYYEANEQTLGVGIRRLQQFFNEYEENKVKVEKKLNPKPKPLRHQNKVECQGSRIRFTNSQKLDFLRQYERAKRNESGLETKEFVLEDRT